MEVAVAAESIPPHWYDDDRTLLTILDVLYDRAERMKRRR